MTLAETQALFHEALTAGSPLAVERLEACFVGTPTLPAVARVAIYAGMYRARLVDALRETFPSLVKLLGDERFAERSEAYLGRHPSEHHDVGQIGRWLPAYLRERPDPARPDLADLAALEWARHQVFFAPPVEPAGPQALAHLAPEAFATAGLLLSPALAVLRLEHQVAPLWRRLEDGLPPGPALPAALPAAPVAAVGSEAPAEATLAVWRAGFDVFHSALGPDEGVALAHAAAGEPLAVICAAFAGREDPAAAATAAHRAISSWLQEGWVVGVTAPLGVT